jgi:(p)ppGpp synthase/HD superfamily hydrolase
VCICVSVEWYVLNLSRGATVVDAAFQIHTDVGLQMQGVEINGKPVRLCFHPSFFFLITQSDFH